LIAANVGSGSQINNNLTGQPIKHRNFSGRAWLWWLPLKQQSRIAAGLKWKFSLRN